MDKVERNLVILEINLLLILSVILGNSIVESIFIIFEFMAIRTFLGAKHYDNQIQCLVMTMLLMTSIFLVLKINFGLAIIITAFTSINLSNMNIDVNKIKELIDNFFAEGFMFKKRGDTKYSNIDQFVKENQNTEKLKAFEKILEEGKNKRLYEIYKIRFYEKAEDGLYVSQTYIENKANINHRTLIDYLNKIENIFENFIEEYDKQEEKQESLKKSKELLKK